MWYTMLEMMLFEASLNVIDAYISRLFSEISWLNKVDVSCVAAKVYDSKPSALITNAMLFAVSKKSAEVASLENSWNSPAPTWNVCEMGCVICTWNMFKYVLPFLALMKIWYSGTRLIVLAKAA